MKRNKYYEAVDESEIFKQKKPCVSKKPKEIRKDYKMDDVRIGRIDNCGVRLRILHRQITAIREAPYNTCNEAALQASTPAGPQLN